MHYLFTCNKSWCISTDNDLKNWDYWVKWKQSEVWYKQKIMCKQEMMIVDCVYNRINNNNNNNKFIHSCDID